ncbi:hypothetical protein BJX99DRAFT_228633 [Aspergillus californicus]
MRLKPSLPILIEDLDEETLFFKLGVNYSSYIYIMIRSLRYWPCVASLWSFILAG